MYNFDEAKYIYCERDFGLKKETGNTYYRLFTNHESENLLFIGNNSSGKMGYHLAKQAANLGAEVTIIMGPSNLNAEDEGILQINVKTAEEMLVKVQQYFQNSDIAIFSAAVADYKVKNKEKDKIKKKESMDLSLEKNIDILGHISNHNSLRPKIVIGFAAETNNLTKNSKTKLSEKNCDWMIANDVSDPSIGFESDFNEVSIFYKNMDSEKLPKMKKSLLADKIVKRVISQLN